MANLETMNPNSGPVTITEIKQKMSFLVNTTQRTDKSCKNCRAIADGANALHFNHISLSSESLTKRGALLKRRQHSQN